MTKKVLVTEEQLPVAVAGLYRRMTGRILYVAGQRPDSQQAVKELARGLSSPTNIHWARLKRAMRYLAASEARDDDLTATSAGTVVWKRDEAQPQHDSDDESHTKKRQSELRLRPSTTAWYQRWRMQNKCRKFSVSTRKRHTWFSKRIRQQPKKPQSALDVEGWNTPASSSDTCKMLPRTKTCSCEKNGTKNNLADGLTKSVRNMLTALKSELTEPRHENVSIGQKCSERADGCTTKFNAQSPRRQSSAGHTNIVMDHKLFSTSLRTSWWILPKIWKNWQSWRSLKKVHQHSRRASWQMNKDSLKTSFKMHAVANLVEERSSFLESEGCTNQVEKVHTKWLVFCRGTKLTRQSSSMLLSPGSCTMFHVCCHHSSWNLNSVIRQWQGTLQTRVETCLFRNLLGDSFCLLTSSSPLQQLRRCLCFCVVSRLLAQVLRDE